MGLSLIAVQTTGTAPITRPITKRLVVWVVNCLFLLQTGTVGRAINMQMGSPATRLVLQVVNYPLFLPAGTECPSSDDESTSMYSEVEGGMDLDVDVFVLSSDEDSDISWFTQLCTCEGRAHARQCPLNPRNRGAASHALPSKTTEPTPSSAQW